MLDNVFLVAFAFFGGLGLAELMLAIGSTPGSRDERNAAVLATSAAVVALVVLLLHGLFSTGAVSQGILSTLR